ncbi:CinA family protein [Aliamphritea hakodatensis]|uniref:CinA family protein n=1 Tax=Aliamphritea hakodatensis TaxID=2895352 RepID=UPI0022FD6236|nr:CinA family protein [Aliamphritea hakodatensis]
MTTEIIEKRVRELATLAESQGVMIATAESCTGGGIATAITELAGSSAWFDAGFVTYSNQAKTRMLDVPASVIEAYGAVSEQVVQAMATGAVTNSQAHISVAVSGVAGPGGGTDAKPVGTVWIAWHSAATSFTKVYQFAGDRAAVRLQAIEQALSGLIKLLDKNTV